MGRKEKRAARKTALLGVLFALAAVLSLVEGALAPALGLPPGTVSTRQRKALSLLKLDLSEEV